MSKHYVRGQAELNAFFQSVPAKLGQNVLRGALRAGMNEVLPVAKANIHSVSGELAAGLTISTSARDGKVMASIKVKGRHAHVAKWIEFGTAAHNIAAKIKGWLSFLNVFAKKVAHPGARAKPFLRPALDGQAGAAVAAAAEYMKKRLATREGFEASSVMSDGDES